MSKWNRFIALVLAVVLLLQCVPVQAAAAMWDSVEPDVPQEESLSFDTALLPVAPVVQEDPMPEPEAPAPILETVPQSTAQSTGELGNLSWTVEDGVLTITGTGSMPSWSYNSTPPWADYRDEVTAVVIGEGVTSVGAYAFTNFTAMESVDLADTVTAIGSYAFQYCAGLKSVELPEGISSVNTQVFGYCTALEEITIPDSVTYIGTGAFSTCTALESITIPESVTVMNTHIFQSCTSLREIQLSANITTISANMFADCSALETITLPDTVTGIANNAFLDCAALHDIVLPESLSTMGSYVFKNCTALESISLPDGVTTMGQSIFSGCASLVTVDLPAGLTTLGANVFQHCPALEEVTMPDGLTSIGSCAFQNCVSLRSIAIPDGVATIGQYAFDGCTALEDVRLPAGLTELGNGVLSHCPVRQLILPEGLTTIGAFAFQDCSALEQIVLPDTVATVGQYAFAECAALREAVLSAGMTEIPAQLFSQCAALERVTLPEGIQTIGYSAFTPCPALRVVELPETLVSIGERVFLDCVSLQSVTLPDSLTTLGANAFMNCTALRELRLSDSLTELPFNAFSGCNALERVEIPKSMTTIGTNAFYGCYALEDVLFSEGLTEICDFAFYGCSALKDITLPDTLTRLDASAFADCIGLTQIHLPAGLTSLEGYVFQNCIGLTSVTIPDTVTNISYGAFAGCTGLSRLDILENVTSIASDAFTGCTNVTFYTHPDAYAWSYAESHGIPVVNVLTSVDLTLTVLDETGNVLTEGVTIEWYPTGSEELLATGSTLRGVNKEELAYDYRILLNEDLSYRFHQPLRTAVVIENDCYDLTHSLPAIDSVTLSGAVLDNGGQPVANAALHLTQSYNERYEKELSVVAGADGTFSIRADAVPTQLRIDAEGFYSRTVSADLTEKTDSYQIADLTMTPLPADRITLDVERIQVHEPGTVGFREAVADSGALEFTVYNVTRNQEITDFTVQPPWLLLGETAADAGDTIRIRAVDPRNTMTAEPVVLALDEQRMGRSSILFLENGVFTLEQILAAGETQLMVFDAEGRLADSGAASSGYVSRGLSEGTYQLILLEQNRLLRSVGTLALLEQLGLTEGRDYARVDVTVKQGLITAVESVTVPDLDESLLNYMDDQNTRLRLGRVKAYPEQMVSLQLSYRIDSRYPTSGETVRIELPENVCIASAVFLDSVSVPYSLEGNTLVIPVHAASGELSVYIRAQKVGTYFLSPMLDFETGGGQVLQPLGQVRLTVSAGELSVPARTSRTQVPISGTTMPDRLVQVYVNGEQVGTTTSNAVGSWDLTVPLTGTYDHSYHQIQAKIAGEEEGTFHVTEPVYLIYDMLDIEVSTVTMYNKIHYDLPQTTVFNFIVPDKDLRYLVPDEDVIHYSFRVRFTGGDDTVLRNVVLVMEDLRGDEHRCRCSYDAATNSWLTSFTTRELEESPCSLGVSYELYHQPGDLIVDAQMTEDIRQAITGTIAEIDEHLDAIEYVDDGSADDLDFHELAALIDAELDELERLSDETQYFYDTTMSELALSFEREDDTITTTMGSITTDSTIIELEEVDETQLLNDGYEKIPSTDGTCLYQKVSGNTVRYVYPAEKIMLVVNYHDDAQAAQALASGTPDVFALMDTAIYKALNAIAELSETVNSFLATIQRSVSDLEAMIQQSELRKEKLLNRAEKLEKRMDELIDMGYSAEELREMRDQCAKRWNRMMKVIGQIRQNRELLKVMKVLEAVGKAVPIFGLAGSVADAKKYYEELKGLWNSLPGSCPADPGGLQAIRTEITNLTWFLYGKIVADVILDIASITTVFTTGVAAIPVTGGASLAGAIAIVALMTASNFFADKWVNEYTDIKLCDIKLMIANLKCDTPKEQPGGYPKQMVSARVVLDPSGYVYEAVPSNRVEGVKAEIYYKDGETDVLWDAENYDQVNPCYTDAAGFFHWDVPVGQWLVKFSKEGYYDTDSRLDPAADEEGYLPVPPPQMQVNTAIVSRAAPTVQSVQVYHDEVLVIFSQYMKPDTVRLSVDCGGAVSGTITASDAEWNYEQTEQYATVFRFTPDRELSGETRITIDGAVNYAGTPLAAGYDESLTVTVRPESIFAADPVSMAYGSEYQLEVQILPAEAGAGRTITAESLFPELLQVLTPQISADETGKAIVTVHGELPGNAELTLRLDGTDLKTTSSFTISLEEDVAEICEKVTASIPNGSTVAPGTVLELSTATEGAEIYYTLDGTCPCVVDSPSRIHYTGPITLTEDVFLIAYAVKEGAQDSPTAGFIYTICTHTDTLLENEQNATCTENGYTGDLICTDCGTVLEQGSVIPSTGHSWDEGVITLEPTEEHAGEMRFTCTACGETRTESIPELDHEHRYEAVVTAPTCTEQGYTTHTCRCGDRYVDTYTDALGHDMGEWVTVTAATCTENGEQIRTCTRCDRSETRIIEATGHSFGAWILVQEPTASADGLEERICVSCGHTEQRAVARLENPFTDVPEGSFYYEPVLWAVANGITNGTTPTTFGPNDPCMRAHVVTFLWRAMGSPEPTRTDNPFVDVKPTDFYYKAVLWALENGITSGMDATHFGPTAYCNRAQVVTFLYRTMGSPAVDASQNPFADVPATQWFTAPVLWAVAHGITNGLSATTFGPDAICNRAQIVTFLYRVFVD